LFRSREELEIGVLESHIQRVTTLSTSEASKDLGGVLARALRGEQIGIECGGKIVALRPVEEFEDATAEYGLTSEEVQNSFEAVSRKVEEEVRTGKLTKLA
jgi:hypothetical protein